MENKYLTEKEVSELLGYKEIPPKIRILTDKEAQKEYLRSFLYSYFKQYPYLEILTQDNISKEDKIKLNKLYNELLNIIKVDYILPCDKVFYQICCELIECILHSSKFDIFKLLDKYNYNKYPASIKLEKK